MRVIWSKKIFLTYFSSFVCKIIWWVDSLSDSGYKLSSLLLPSSKYRIFISFLSCSCYLQRLLSFELHFRSSGFVGDCISCDVKLFFFFLIPGDLNSIYSSNVMSLLMPSSSTYTSLLLIYCQCVALWQAKVWTLVKNPI